MIFRILNSYLKVSKLSKIGLGALATAFVGQKADQDVKLYHPTVDQYPNLTIGHCNHMSSCLTPNLYARLCEKTTRFGFTIDDAIQPGVDDPSKPSDAHMGLVAGDEESYELFRELFECAIRRKFGDEGLSHGRRHPENTDFSQMKIDDEIANSIVRIRIRACRNLSRHPFPCWVSRAGRRLIEKTMVDVVDKLVKRKLLDKIGEMRVTYYSLIDLPDSYKANPSLSPYWRSSGVNRDWPDARGAFILNSDVSSSIIININDRDHLRIWTEIEPDTKNSTYKTFIRNIQDFFDKLGLVEDMLLSEQGHGFAWDDQFGYLTSNPSDVGTGIKAEVEIRLPNLVMDQRLASVVRSKCEGRLKIIGIKEDVLKVTNVERIGVSELELIQKLFNDIKVLVETDRYIAPNNSEISDDNK